MSYGLNHSPNPSMTDAQWATYCRLMQHSSVTVWSNGTIDVRSINPDGPSFTGKLETDGTIQFVRSL